jgi:hypothetical protein
VTTSAIDPVTFLFAAQCLNHCATGCPEINTVTNEPARFHFRTAVLLVILILWDVLTCRWVGDFSTFRKNVVPYFSRPGSSSDMPVYSYGFVCGCHFTWSQLARRAGHVDLHRNCTLHVTFIYGLFKEKVYKSWNSFESRKVDNGWSYSLVFLGEVLTIPRRKNRHCKETDSCASDLDWSFGTT